ncbi:hypothetical protein RND71_034582 [Anisodus tanguticus]|uniref:Uncharacterized protein n=1 Tax=Anisodus tanguticus TaxID=243964 RepID=A0AAE1RBP0_9SOLA|nr:hypothetical protein RND71_034582 [Anisodus tanguticus]
MENPTRHYDEKQPRLGEWVVICERREEISRGAEVSISEEEDDETTLLENDGRARVGPFRARLGQSGRTGADVGEGCYLVDLASSHMLVSNIKPCMCKYEQIQIVKLRMAH